MEEIERYIKNNFETEAIRFDKSKTYNTIKVLNVNYDKLRHPERPQYISLSFDQETGYHMTVENFHWEFYDDQQAMLKTAKQYLIAMRDNKVKIKRKLLQKWITFAKDISIIS